MRKIIISISFLLAVLTGMSQNEEFTAAMKEAIGQYAGCKTISDFQALGNRFGLIASTEKTEWLPLYYHAHCYIIMSFMEPTDAAKKDSYLDVAEKSITKMIELAPREAEVYALHAMFLTARLVANPMERGQQYSILVAQAIGKALGLEADNPRAKLIKLQNDMGSAPYFGKDPKDFCPQAKELLANWDNYKVKAPLYPSWGKDQAVQIVEGCK